MLEIDVDSGEVAQLRGDKPLTPDDLAARPELGRVVARIDGKVLDATGQLWYQGKGDRGCEARGLEARDRQLDPGRPRRLGRGRQRPGRHLCPRRPPSHGPRALLCRAGLRCGETVVRFTDGAARDARPIGGVRVARSGTEEIELENDGDRALLERLWGAFKHRYPHHRERFAQRAAVMQMLGSKIVALRRSPKRSTPGVGAAKVCRNQPCRCGSGKKHKKCCGAA